MFFTLYPLTLLRNFNILSCSSLKELSEFDTLYPTVNYEVSMQDQLTCTYVYQSALFITLPDKKSPKVSCSFLPRMVNG